MSWVAEGKEDLTNPVREAEGFPFHARGVARSRAWNPVFPRGHFARRSRAPDFRPFAWLLVCHLASDEPARRRGRPERVLGTRRGPLRARNSHADESGCLPATDTPRD